MDEDNGVLAGMEDNVFFPKFLRVRVWAGFVLRFSVGAEDSVREQRTVRWIIVDIER